MNNLSAQQRTYTKIIALFSIIFASLNLRPAIASVSPLIEIIQSDLSLSYATISLLTTIPVICMGVFAFITPLIVNWFGREGGLLYALVLIGLATFARTASHYTSVLILSTVAVGVGIAVGQTLLPSVVDTYFPDKSELATGAYSIGLTIGAALATALTVPIYDLTSSWPISLAVWSVLAIIGIVAVSLLRCSVKEKPNQPPSFYFQSLPWNSKLSWIITFYFAVSSAVFFSGLTWLSPRYIALGWTETEAGYLLTLYVVAQVAGMAAISLLGSLTTDRRPWIFSLTTAIILGSSGITFAPQIAPVLWTVLFGGGIGGLFTMTLLLPVDFTKSTNATDRLSAMGMGIGYILAGIGPLVVGAIRDISGDYMFSFLFISLMSSCVYLMTIQLSPDRNGTIK